MKRLILTVSVLAAVAGCSRASSTPAGVVEDFMRRMENGGCAGIGDSLSAQSKAMVGPKIEQVCNANAEMKKATKVTKTIGSVNVLEATENGDRATVRLEAVFSDGSKEGGEPITLVRENGAWKIDLMATGMGGSGGGMGGGGMGGGGMGGGPAPTAPMGPPAMPAPSAAPPTPAAPAPADATEAEEAPEPADAEK